MAAFSREGGFKWGNFKTKLPNSCNGTVSRNGGTLVASCSLTHLCGFPVPIQTTGFPMTRSTYGRDDFEGLRLFILIFCFSISVFFTAIHTVQRLFYTPPILTANSRLLKNSILSANWLIIVMYIPFLITYTVVSIDDDVHICRGIHIWGLVSYTVINFCFYRVLLYRSQAYDVMKEYEKTYFYVYWGVHIVCPGLVASVAFVAGIGNYEIRTENIRGGNRLCVIDGFHFIPYISGSVPALMLAFADLGISLGCLSLLVLPLLKPGFTHRGETGVVRNVIFSSIAIISTFTTLVIMAIFEFNDGYWTVGLVMEIGNSVTTVMLMLNIQ
ncbi:hypothetical protein AAMO2058_000287900 [Amorphochlora amoebiformis]